MAEFNRLGIGEVEDTIRALPSGLSRRVGAILDGNQRTYCQPSSALKERGEVSPYPSSSSSLRITSGGGNEVHRSL
jgi:hypothetical protein